MSLHYLLHRTEGLATIDTPDQISEYYCIAYGVRRPMNVATYEFLSQVHNNIDSLHFAIVSEHEVCRPDDAWLVNDTLIQLQVPRGNTLVL